MMLRVSFGFLQIFVVVAYLQTTMNNASLHILGESLDGTAVSKCERVSTCFPIADGVGHRA